ncbi:MAG: TIGR00266 family protein [Opitutaceae bacterium]
MNATIAGTVMQTVQIELAPGEQVYCQTHAMAWMTDDVRMETNTGGGLFAGLSRSLSGGSFFITTYTASGSSPSRIAFAPRFPGSILPFKLDAGQSLVCRKETFLVAEKTVTLDIAFQQRLGAGVFGGEGFILQRVTGPGTVWLDLSGEVVSQELAAGQRLLVQAGHVGIITPSVGFDIQRVRGARNLIFGGEGIFLASLAGPGKVWLQSMPILNLAEEVARYMPQGQAVENTTAGGVIGGLVGGLLGGGGH